MIFNLVLLPARQTGSSTQTKVLLRIMLRDTTVCEDDLVKQALSPAASPGRRSDFPISRPSDVRRLSKLLKRNIQKVWLRCFLTLMTIPRLCEMSKKPLARREWKD